MKEGRKKENMERENKRKARHSEKDRQCTYNVTYRYFRATTVAVGKPICITYEYSEGFFISFIYTLSPLWDYQYKYDIVHITLSVET